MLLLAALFLSACALACSEPVSSPASPPPAATATDVFTAWLEPGAPVASGFSAPEVRAGVVTSLAEGVVVETGDRSVTVEHAWYENHEPHRVRAVWQELDPLVQRGDLVGRDTPLGHAERAAVRLEHRTNPAFAHEGLEGFVMARPHLFVPQDEPVLALLHHESYTLRIYESGVLTYETDLALGQAEGAKVRRGDNRTPKGMYFVVQRSRGPFGGPYGDYYGGHWTKLNYPNAYDAARGVDLGLITPSQQVGITRAWRRRALTNQRTRLGSGIGLHGWASEWAAEPNGPWGRHKSWGCVVLHLRDVAEVYDALPEGAMVVLF